MKEQHFQTIELDARCSGQEVAKMRILVIESSPHKNGSSNLLADKLICGARKTGHIVSTFDAARADYELGKSMI